jgi:hypothetical protein
MRSKNESGKGFGRAGHRQLRARLRSVGDPMAQLSKDLLISGPLSMTTNSEHLAQVSLSLVQAKPGSSWVMLRLSPALLTTRFLKTHQQVSTDSHAVQAKY